MNFTKIVPKKTKKITHQEVDKATAEFLKKGGKIKKIKNVIDGPDFQQRLDQADISFNKSRYSHQFGFLKAVNFTNGAFYE